MFYDTHKRSLPYEWFANQILIQLVNYANNDYPYSGWDSNSTIKGGNRRQRDRTYIRHSMAFAHKPLERR